ncbi:hypothetical protein K1T71_005707 [Dendrolimus kikuchii]|uniref:Uncharacterized protein n=1 Tax=Dendrolimus kikuchii TaxID=765133 RepID=A0ACC1D5Y1_9NEOP|nr:hypothetical protein K1T71_005707 [Dendrolimus kikuchii]
MISPTRILQIISFLDLFSIGLVLPQLANRALALGCNHILIGIMGALYSGFQLISGPIAGSLSDIKGRKPILLLSLCVCGIAYLLLGLTSSIAVFFALRSILGLSKQTQLLTNALAPDYVKDGAQQSVAYGRIASLSGIGMSLGPIISGHVMEAYPDSGFTIITSAMGIIFALNFGLVKTLPDVKKKKEDRANSAIASNLMGSIIKSLKQSIGELYKIDWTTYWDVFLVKLIVTLAMGLYFSSFALFLKTEHQVQPKNLGYIVSIQGVFGSLSTYFIGYINAIYSDPANFSRRIFDVFFVLTLSFTCMAAAPNVASFAIILVPFAMSTAISRVLTMEIITTRCKSSNRGTVIGASTSVKSLSGIITPLISGIIIQYLGLIYAFYTAALISSLGIIASFKIESTDVKEKSK